MTQPVPPTTVGLQPQGPDALNLQVGAHLRAFLDVKNTINQDREFLQATDLKAAPYGFSADQETLIKSSVLALDDAFDAIDMTFIARVIGLG